MAGSPMAKGKSISRQQSIGERGRHLFSERVLAAGLSFHPTGPLDAGIDGFIELRDPQTGGVRAQYVMAQLKNKDDGTFNQESSSSFSWPVDQRDLEYWLGSNAPVILVVARLSDQLMVWKSIQDYFSTPDKRTSRKILFNKTQDALSIPMAKSLVASLSICCSAVCRKGCAGAFSFTIKNAFSCFLADHRSSARSHTSHIEGVRCATWSRLAGERSTDPARPIIGTLRLRHDLSSSGANGIWPSNRPTTSRQMATRNIRSSPNA
jgi:hypothetical protein